MTTWRIGANYPTDREYADVSTAWAALPSTLDADYVFDLYADAAFTDNWNLSGKTPGSYTVTIKPASGQGFADGFVRGTSPFRYDTSKVRIESSYGVTNNIWVVAVGGVIIDGLQFMLTGRNDNYMVVLTAPSNTVVVKNCILYGGTQTTFLGGFFDSLGQKIINNLVYGANIGTAAYLDGGNNGYPDAGIFENNTLYATSGTLGVNEHINDDNIVRNNAIFGFTTAVSVGTGTGGYNAGDDTNTAHYGGTTGNLDSLTASVEFVSPATDGTADFTIKTGSALINAAYPDATNTGDLDAVGQARSGTTPTIGALEFESPVATSNYYIGSDITPGDWTTSTGSGTLTSMVDETTRDDTDYIQSATNPSADLVELEWANVQVPSVNTNHTVSYVLKGDASCQAIVGLLAGDATTVTAWVHTALPPTFTRFDRNLSTAACDAFSVGGYAGAHLTVTAG